MVEDPAEHDPGSSEEHPAKPGTAAWRCVLLVVAASRLFYLCVGALLAPVVPVSPLQSQTSIFTFGTLSIWANFDGEHYVGVTESGYEEESPAFFPLYPLLVRSAAALFGGSVSPGALSFRGVLVSLVAYGFALYFVYRIAEEEWGVRAAQGACSPWLSSPPASSSTRSTRRACSWRSPPGPCGPPGCVRTSCWPRYWRGLRRPRLTWACCC